MLLQTAENLKPKQGFGEVVDALGKPLCIMRHTDISQQHLMHRSCILLVIDKTGHLILKKGKDGWSVSNHAKLSAWESHDDCAQGLLASEWKMAASARLVYQGICLPCPENGNAYTSVYHAQMESVAHITPLLDMEHHLIVNKTEISMLRRLEKFFSPMLLVLLDRNLI